MRRRDFLAACGLAGLAPLSRPGALSAADSDPAERDYYELRRYEIETEEQKSRIETFLEKAAIPALGRIGVPKVGVFLPQEGIGPIRVLLQHRSLESFATATSRLLADKEYRKAGAELLDTPATRPAYRRIESSLLVAFRGMPRLATPVTAPGRILQLRTYESPSVVTGQKKIEMFNDGGEIEIFRRVGLHPVFFGEALAGDRLPNLTYMLAFRDMDELKESWRRFGRDAGWRKLRAIAEYADERILSNITNILLRPASFSQI